MGKAKRDQQHKRDSKTRNKDKNTSLDDIIEPEEEASIPDKPTKGNKPGRNSDEVVPKFR
eukprot:16440732-Heterocapsa_arctica.AAC.1